MIDWVKIIENDDIETFKTHFKLENWKNTITQIENYAGLNKYINEITYNDADVFKYALHCESDKIFNYLLPVVDTEKHGNNYGWPLLSMALKKGRYDYALAIISHDSFNPFHIYHLNCFGYVDTYKDPKNHLDFLFEYLNKFDKWTFKIKYADKSFIYQLTHLICYNEECLKRFEKYYQTIMEDKSLSFLDVYKDRMEILAEEILYNNYKKFILDKLSPDNIKEMLKNSFDNNILLSKIAEGNHQLEALKYLIQAPEILTEHLYRSVTLFDRFSLDSLLLLEPHMDMWQVKNNTHTLAPIDFILHPENKNEEVISYFVNKYPQKIIEKYSQKSNRNRFVEMSEKKLLQMKLENDLIKNNNGFKKSKL